MEGPIVRANCRDSPFGATTAVHCSSRSYMVNGAKLTALTGLIRSCLGVASHHLNINFVGATAMRRLNQQFRGKDKSTDVLSFPQNEWRTPLPVRTARAKSGAALSLPVKSAAHAKLPMILGDLVISLPDAAANAQSLGQGLDREVCFLLVHGILHLCGYDHEKAGDERRMLAAQRSLMKFLSPPRQKPLWKSSVKVKKR